MMAPAPGKSMLGAAALPPALELRGVSKRFGNTTVLHRLSLAVQAGQSVAIIGPNGAGKSTLFDLISGRTRADTGEIWLKHQRIDGKPAYVINRMGLSRSFQVSRVFARLSVFDNLRCAALWSLGHRYVFWRALAGLRDVAARANAVLGQIGLVRRATVLAGDLSYAEQRALEFGITIVGGADVILLDEPTAGMSRSETLHFTQLIRALTVGKTLVTVEHDMEVVFDLAERIAVLVQGELLAFDTPASVRADARVQAAYLGAQPQLPAPAQIAPC